MGALFHLSTLLAEDPQQQTNNNIVISDGSDIASGVIYIGYQPAYEQIQESEVVCRYIPNLLEEAASGKSEMTIDPVVIKPSTKKLILVCDNPYRSSSHGITAGNFNITGLKDFQYSANENVALTVFTDSSQNPYNYRNDGPERELLWDLNHFGCLKRYLVPDSKTTVEGCGDYLFACATFNVDENKVKETGSLHFTAAGVSGEALFPAKESDLSTSIDIIVPIQIEAEGSN